MNQAVPHDVMQKDCSRMLDRPVTEVVLEQARGPLGRPKLTVSLSLWLRIAAVALPKYELQDDRRVLAVPEAAMFVTALKQNEAKTSAWPRFEREVFSAVLSLLYKHDGLVINRR
jgi:hypothetical protein